MPIEFETKKLSMETLGEYLAAIRNELGLTLEEVAQKTGIYEKFIHYLETGKYHLLPPGVYVCGFLKKLSEVYKVSPDSLINQYRKESGIVEHIASSKLANEKSWKAKLKQVTITPKLITISVSALVGVFAFLYVVFQVFAINKTPTLVISEPKNDTVINGSTVNVTGKTEPGITIAINGQNVFVNPEGNFTTTIGVAPGQKELKIAALNKFGKTSEQILALRVEEPKVAGAETAIPSELQLELKFLKDTKIEMKKDGVDIPAEIIPAGAIKQVSAKESLDLTTYDGGNTEVSLNGKPLGKLGKTGEKITIPFSKDAANLVEKTLD